MRLDWQKSPYPAGTNEEYTAQFRGGEYVIYKWNKEWRIRRTGVPLLHDFGGGASTLKEAKLYCDSNYETQVKRLLDWVDYWLTTDPPTEGTL